MPDSNAPTLETWRALYDAAQRVKDLAPWEWMSDTDVFAVQNPESGDLVFVDVDGEPDELCVVTVYLDARSLYHITEVMESGEFLPQLVFDTAQLTAAFTDRRELETQDMATIRQLGLKFRGTKMWPKFRIQHPAHFPWFLEERDARLLVVVLEQVLAVAPRVKDNPGLLPDAQEKRYLVRYAEPQEGGGLVWQEREQEVPEPGPVPIALEIDDELIARVKAYPRQNLQLEIDALLLPTPVTPEDGPPYFPYGFLIVDHEDGDLLKAALVSPVPDWIQAWKTVAQHVIVYLDEAGTRPNTVYVKDRQVESVLQSLAELLGFRVRMRDDLPLLSDLEFDMLRHMVQEAGLWDAFDE